MFQRITEPMLGRHARVALVGFQHECAEGVLAVRGDRSDALGQIVGQHVAVVGAQERFPRPEFLQGVGIPERRVLGLDLVRLIQRAARVGEIRKDRLLGIHRKPFVEPGRDRQVRQHAMRELVRDHRLHALHVALVQREMAIAGVDEDSRRHRILAAIVGIVVRDVVVVFVLAGEHHHHMLAVAAFGRDLQQIARDAAAHRLAELHEDLDLAIAQRRQQQEVGGFVDAIPRRRCGQLRRHRLQPAACRSRPERVSRRGCPLRPLGLGDLFPHRQRQTGVVVPDHVDVMHAGTQHVEVMPVGGRERGHFAGDGRRTRRGCAAEQRAESFEHASPLRSDPAARLRHHRVSALLSHHLPCA